MLWLVIVFLLTPPPATVQQARALFRTGEAAERAGDLSAATEAYQHSLRADPGGHFAGRAHARLNVLRARPTQDAAVLQALDALRRTAHTLPPAEAAQRAQALLDRARAPQTQAELHLWLAAASPHPTTVREHAYAAAHTPGATAVQVRRAFEQALSAATPAQWSAHDAQLEAWAGRWPQRAAAVGIATQQEALWDLRARRVARWVAWLNLALLAGLLLWHRAWRAFTPSALGRWRPWRGLLYLSWAFGAAALLAQRFEPGFGWVLSACGLAALPISLASGALGQTPRQAPRWLVIPVVLGASLGAVFLALHRLGQTALMGM